VALRQKLRRVEMPVQLDGVDAVVPATMKSLSKGAVSSWPFFPNESFAFCFCM
jgi:hypothetical protein